MSNEQRQQAVQKFQTDENINYFLISLKAGGVGLNLTQADYVFIIDPWWNPAVEQQAIDRSHRIGQTKTVFTYKFITKDTVEEKILALQQKKKELASSIITNEESFIKTINVDEIIELLS
jgi:SNF2 family DNA or RNA helicase